MGDLFELRAWLLEPALGHCGRGHEARRLRRIPVPVAVECTQWLSSQWLSSPMQANTRPSGCPQLSNAAISALTSALEPRAIVLFAQSPRLQLCMCVGVGCRGVMSEVRGCRKSEVLIEPCRVHGMHNALLLVCP